mmetsp:Transcript_20772/g.44758  ORF Transcript_20772/g.44758 Transcript_20772/m.44758 type:complete len:595 (-) Transcript_20772:112-1896(-)
MSKTGWLCCGGFYSIDHTSADERRALLDGGAETEEGAAPSGCCVRSRRPGRASEDLAHAAAPSPLTMDNAMGKPVAPAAPVIKKEEPVDRPEPQPCQMSEPAPEPGAEDGEMIWGRMDTGMSADVDVESDAFFDAEEEECRDDTQRELEQDMEGEDFLCTLPNGATVTVIQASVEAVQAEVVVVPGDPSRLEAGGARVEAAQDDDGEAPARVLVGLPDGKSLNSRERAQTAAAITAALWIARDRPASALALDCGGLSLQTVEVVVATAVARAVAGTQATVVVQSDAQRGAARGMLSAEKADQCFSGIAAAVKQDPRLEPIPLAVLAELPAFLPSDQSVEAAARIVHAQTMDSLGELTAFQTQWCTLANASRVLRSANGDVTKAVDSFLFSLRWRQEHEELLVHRVLPFAPPCDVRILGQDKDGRSIVYFCAGTQTSGVSDVFQQFATVMEASIERNLGRAGACRSILILDCSGFGLWHNSRPYGLKECAKVLATVYSERMHRILLVDMLKVCGFLWELASPFISERTRKKLAFVTSEEALKEMAGICDETNVSLLRDTMAANREAGATLEARAETWRCLGRGTAYSTDRFAESS